MQPKQLPPRRFPSGLPGSRRRVAALRPAVAALAAVMVAAMAPSALALPEGRAYEMVSPPDKNGNDILPTDVGSAVYADPVRSSLSGDAVLYASFGAFGDVASAANPSQYRATRGSLAWSTIGVTPPYADTFSNFNGLSVQMVSDDLARSVVITDADLDGPMPPPTDFTRDRLYLAEHDTGAYRLLTPPPVSGDWDYVMNVVDASADLSHVLLEGTGRLTADASSDHTGKLYVWHDGALTLASVLPDGTQAPNASAGGENGNPGFEVVDNAMSADGSVVYFTAIASSDVDPEPLYRRAGGQTVIVNEEENLVEDVPLGSADFRGASPSGRYVVFRSSQRLVEEDVDSLPDLYRYDADAPDMANLTLLSRPVGAPDAADVQGVLGMSANADRVYFVAAGRLTDEVPTAPEPERKVYLWQEGPGGPSVSYVGGLPSSDVLVWDAGDPNVGGGVRVVRPRRTVAPNGEALLLTTSTPMTTEDTGGWQQVYRYDRTADELVCISCPSTGLPAGPATLYAQTDPAASHLVFENHVRRNLSDDGGRAFFETATALVPEDTNQRIDVYMWEDGEVHLVSSGKSGGSSYFGDASPSGDSVFFTTDESPVGWDVDDNRDLYVARVGGGLPEPPDVAGPCLGDECQGGPAAVPQPTDPDSASFNGSGDLASGPRATFSARRMSRAARNRLARGRSAVLRARVSRAGRVSVLARARIGGRRVVVARGARHVRRRGHIDVPLRLSRRGRATLSRSGRLTLVLTVRFTGAAAVERQMLTLSGRRAGK